MNNWSGIIIAPLGTLYGGVMRARGALYRKGILRVHRISSPVISIGNITTGGTGKTPLVEWVARAVAGAGGRVCILSRGYGRAQAGTRVLVSDGKRIMASVKEAGDEPLLLAEMLLGVASVISDADRVAAARWAEANLGCDAFILDDGFQHRRLGRDLDIVVVDATNPWGGGTLLPRGRLREPLTELTRADCVIITRSEQTKDIASLRKQVECRTAGRPVLLSRTRTRALRPLDEATPEAARSSDSLGLAARDPGHLSSHTVAAFCGIGNPVAFFEHVRREGHVLKFTRAFGDHHVYTQHDVDKVASEARQAGAEYLITTAKDSVKLRPLHFDLPCYVLEIGLEFDEEAKLLAMIREAIQNRPTRNQERTTAHSPP